MTPQDIAALVDTLRQYEHDNYNHPPEGTLSTAADLLEEMFVLRQMYPASFVRDLLSAKARLEGDLEDTRANYAQLAKELSAIRKARAPRSKRKLRRGRKDAQENPRGPFGGDPSTDAALMATGCL